MVMRFGSWNVRTLLQAGNMNITAEEAERYKMDVAAVQEIRWKGKDSIRKSKFTINYSGNEDRQGSRGVGFIVFKKLTDRYWDLHPSVKEYAPYELKANSIILHLLMYMHPQKILRMK
jgi:exonuclease III